MSKERSKAKIFGELAPDGRVVLNVTGSSDIAEFVRGGRTLAEVHEVTTEDGLRIEYMGTGNFRLISPNREILASFLRSVSFSIGKRRFKKGSLLPLP